MDGERNSKNLQSIIMAKKLYEIKLTGVTVNGQTCANPSVEWENPTCGDVRCYIDGGKTLKVEIPDGCDECFYVVIGCPDQCEDCPPQRKKICPCDTNADCPDCESCVNGICAEDCPGKPCDNGTCVDCTDEVPCPSGQICVSGKCQCPPSKPFVDSKGICRECVTDEQCPPCHICTPDGCVPIVCPEGVCNPETETCVDCLVANDCGENECCVGNSCNCCPGFVRDFTTGKCVPEPDCSKDTDCKECEICVEGTCVPVQCPDGYVCVGGVCVPECDCFNKDCTGNRTCLPLDSTTCFCAPCEGACNESADCGEGCFCDNGECRANPCSGACNNGADCGDGCGCLDGQCVPCESLSCSDTDCSEALGCNCQGQNCVPTVGCNNSPCVTSNDCAEGCTCYEGTCVGCDNFPCSDSSCSDQEGCACNGSDCDGDGGGDGCPDTFVLSKKEGLCQLEAKLTKGTDEGCACPALTIEGYLSRFQDRGDSYRFDGTFKLRKGTAQTRLSALNLPTLGDTSNSDIADNEMASQGTVTLIVDVQYKEYNDDNIFTGYSTDSAVFTTSSSVVNRDTVVIPDIDLPALGVRGGLNQRREANKFTFKLLVSDLEFPNTCNYDKETVAQFSVNKFDDLGASVASLQEYGGVAVLTTSDKRLPLFKWFKSKTGTFGNQEAFRKAYIPQAGPNMYSDTLYGPGDIPANASTLVPPQGELYAGYSYLVTNDCSCKEEDQIDNLCFDNPEQLNFELKNCGSKIDVLPPFRPCAVNGDLTNFVNAPSDAQTTYTLYLNGQNIATFQDVGGLMQNTSGGSMFGSYTIDNQTPINTVELRQNHGAGKCDFLEIVSPEILEPPRYTVDCSTTGSTLALSVPANQLGNTVTQVSTSSGQISNGPSFTVLIPKGQEVTVTVTYESGCQVNFKVNETCCESFGGVVNSSGGSCSASTTTLTAVPSGGQFPYSFQWTGPDGQPIFGNTSNINVDRTTASGTYQVVVTDAQGCKATLTKAVSQNVIPQVSISAPPVLCTGQTTDVVITVSDAPNATINYSVAGVAAVGQLNGSTLIIPNVAPDSQIIVSGVQTSGCNYTTNEIALIREASAVNLTIALDTTQICAGESAVVQVTGTPNANIAIYSGNPNSGGQLIVSNTLGTNGTFSAPVSPKVDTTYYVVVPGPTECDTTIGPPVTLEVLDTSGSGIIMTPSEDVIVCEDTSPYQLTISNTDRLPATYTVIQNSNLNGVTNTTVSSDPSGNAVVSIAGESGETVRVNVASATIETCSVGNGAEVNITFVEAPTLNITASSSTICAGETVTITVSSTTGEQVQLTPAPAGSNGLLTFPEAGGSQVVTYTQSATISYSIVSRTVCTPNYINQSVVVSLDSNTTPSPISTPCLENSNIRQFNFGVDLESVTAVNSVGATVTIPISVTNRSFQLDSFLYTSVTVTAVGSTCPRTLSVFPCAVTTPPDDPAPNTVFTVQSPCHTPPSFVSGQAEAYEFEVTTYDSSGNANLHYFTVPYVGQSMNNIIQTFAQQVVIQGLATGFTVTPANGTNCPFPPEGGFGGIITFTGVLPSEVISFVTEYYTLPGQPSRNNVRVRQYTVINTLNP